MLRHEHVLSGDEVRLGIRRSLAAHMEQGVMPRAMCGRTAMEQQAELVRQLTRKCDGMDKEIGLLGETKADKAELRALRDAMNAMFEDVQARLEKLLARFRAVESRMDASDKGFQEALAALKDRLDPAGILNPGVLVGAPVR